ncbi:hypothetical protein AGMMS49546_29470 [Spirochaetia bacterium]|nr:hypothetical protein AGMMS49546_29470 [Spirochaetia bacterium]
MIEVYRRVSRSLLWASARGTDAAVNTTQSTTVESIHNQDKEDFLPEERGLFSFIVYYCRNHIGFVNVT